MERLTWSSKIEDIIDQVRNGKMPHGQFSMYSSEKKKYETMYPDMQFTAAEPQKLAVKPVTGFR